MRRRRGWILCVVEEVRLEIDLVVRGRTDADLDDR
jgi:hypothetical protein